ncbi:hypothetical protein ABZ801_24935 [Actinomadura sp. NPDC047616]|uniref:hypothetical protein n=1 Tax=Actinomadura sp. NPDC047616 TaxID=3155914 RepID=UPI0033F04629
MRSIIVSAPRPDPDDHRRGRAHPPGTASAAITQHTAADITVAPDGFTAPTTIPAGAAAFRATSTDPGGAYIGLVRLRPGVRLHQYLAHLVSRARNSLKI